MAAGNLAVNGKAKPAVPATSKSDGASTAQGLRNLIPSEGTIQRLRDGGSIRLSGQFNASKSTYADIFSDRGFGSETYGQIRFGTRNFLSKEPGEMRAMTKPELAAFGQAIAKHIPKAEAGEKKLYEDLAKHIELSLEDK